MISFVALQLEIAVTGKFPPASFEVVLDLETPVLELTVSFDSFNNRSLLKDDHPNHRFPTFLIFFFL